MGPGSHREGVQGCEIFCTLKQLSFAMMPRRISRRTGTCSRTSSPENRRPATLRLAGGTMRTGHETPVKDKFVCGRIQLHNLPP
jgi:hypothetical protein